MHVPVSPKVSKNKYVASGWGEYTFIQFKVNIQL